MNIWHKMGQIDRRILWGVQMVIVFAVLLRPLGLPITVGDETRQLYDFFESLPEGSIIWADFGFSGGGVVELGPMVRTFFHHAFTRNLRVVGGTLWTEGPTMAQSIFEEVVLEYPGKAYGIDFVNVGYKPGGELLAKSLVDDVWDACRGVDFFAKPLADYPLMKEVPRLTKEHVAAVVVFAEGSPGGGEWLASVSAPTGIPLVQGTIQMSIPSAMPYLNSGQYSAIWAGSRGTAEYEFMLGQAGPAIASQDANSLLVVWLLVVMLLGNISHIMTQGGKGR